MGNTLETLIAKQDIADVLARYARGVDRTDGDLLHSCYWDDAIEEHGSSYVGPARAYVDGAIARLAGAGTMGHYLCNVHHEFDESGTVAWVETYVLTFARFPKNGERKIDLWDTLTGGRLIDRFEKRDGEWRIKHRKTILDWNRDQPIAETWCLGMFNPADPRMIMGTRGTGDASYGRF